MADLITIPEGSIVYDISLDLHDLVTSQVVRAKQYDTRTRYIRATIFNDGDLYPITTDKLISFSATKPDGFGIDNSAGIDTDGNIIYIITDQTTAKEGVFDAEFRIYDTEVISGITYSRRKTSFSFKMSVVKSALNDSTVISSYEFNQLTELMGTVGDIVSDGTALIESMSALEAQVEAAEEIRVSDENTRISNEEIRVENEDARYKQFYVTQSQYDALPQEDKDNQKYVYEITDNPDATLISTLTDLLNQINIALAAVEESTVDINNINDLIVTTIQTWSSSKIVSRIRNFKYTASSTVSSITHGLDYNSTTDDLQVYYNGLLLEEGVNFTNSTDFHTINLTSWTVSSGDRVYFKLYKYVK